MKVYLDNAATTAIHPEVIDVMVSMMKNQYGNPSSIHAFGRETRAAIETARKTVSRLLGTVPAEIFFTSGGTEANNMAIRCSIQDMKIPHAITSSIEHHAVLHTLEEMSHSGAIRLSMVNLDKSGRVDLEHLEQLLKENDRSFVSLMHANNEVGTLNPMKEIGEICHRYNAIYHCDTVQTMGHYPFNLHELPVDFVSCAAHKFHGPKGVGFIYISSKVKIKPFITGGSQERNMRGGTENLYGIIGLAKALEISCHEMERDKQHILGLKTYMISKLREQLPDIRFNGDIDESNLYTVLNVSFPPSENAEMLLFNLDIAGIAASGGSACSSGSNVGSHVLKGIGADPDRPAVRFSFCRFNTLAEIDYTIEKLKEFFLVKA